MVHREPREHRIFTTLLHMVPGLEERLTNGSDEEVASIAEKVRRVFNHHPVTFFSPIGLL
jgi:hypothetical protein